VVGNDRGGLGQFRSEAANVRASIPMRGVADSLNVGHTAALLLYEALHQHGRTAGRHQARSLSLTGEPR
jgi:tRNA G18 (ribose-2'-O)-methylase SpoU